MRIDTDLWSVSSATKIGHHHLYKGANCQDAAEFFATDEIICGIGCDGCGEGHYSEVGARMLCNFSLFEVARLHRLNFSPREIVKILFGNITKFIDIQVYLTCQTETPQHIAYYIKHHWLATIVGFILTKDCAGMIFWCGDGAYAFSGPGFADFCEIDQNNTPNYIAYHCLRNPTEVGVDIEVIPSAFETVDTSTSGNDNHIMIASDGFNNHNEQKLNLSRQKYPDLTPHLDGQQWGKKGHFGLKKWMNSRSDRGYFDDDCFIITAERKC
ncbi:hypothetical protein LCGC14_0977480 [marine sediment metagenome]|uniref:PPM-type phosphatase domain-containing protein n=1 Tax=marine sediment metagenome TaxID=412755 RepID=A0A0F9NW53_9ZZZZ